MQASQIRVRPQSSRGVVALRDFLSYAESPPAEEASQSMGTGSFQEATLRGVVESLGLRLVSQVGRSEFRVDYAVFHPEHPKRALLGLMTDDRDYLDSLSVRDRDKLRPADLRRLGWNVHWIWTAAWYDSFAQEKEKLLTALREATQELTESQGDTILQSTELSGALSVDSMFSP